MDFIGVVHLLPLPGSPRERSLAEGLQRAVADAVTLRDHGAMGLIVENFGDAPFAAGRVDAWTIAAMTRIALAVREQTPGMKLGINVLRNDAIGALSIAHAVGADFLRVNVHVGAMVTDQGLIEGGARATLLERRRLGADVAIAADVLVKHAVPLGQPQLEDVAKDTALRGLADVLIVTGSGTGEPADPERARRVKRAVPDCPVWLGSGVTPDNAGLYEADGAIIGTWLHEHGDLSLPLDPARVRTMASVLALS